MASLRNYEIPYDAIFKTTRTLRPWLIGIGCAWAANRLLSGYANNKWLVQSGGAKWKWDEEVAVVTGGSNGMGALMAKGLADRGLTVAVVDIQPLSDGMKHPNIHFFHCDITKPEAVKETAAAIKSQLGAPSILVNNAGIAHAHTILESSPEWLQKLFGVNIISHFYLIQAFLPDMIKNRKGHIVTIASMASFVTAPGLVDYSATKAGALALHEGLNQELKHRLNAPFIKTSVVHPIYVRTQLIDSFADALKTSHALVIKPETVSNAVVKQILSGRSGQICLPSWMSIASGGRGWPSWAQELLRDSVKNDVVGAGPPT